MSDWRPLIEALPVVEAKRLREDKPVLAADMMHEPLMGAPVDAPPMPPSVPAQGRPDAQRPMGDDSMALVRAESEALALRYRAAIEDLVTARDHVIRAAETDMVRLALTIARETIMSDVAGREQFTASMVTHALSLMGQSENITLRIGSNDLRALKQHKPELLARHGVNVIEDVNLNDGGCVAEGTQGRVDASLSARLTAMAKKLLGDAGASA